MKLTLRERFLAKISRDPDNGCWLWLGVIDPTGYGSAYLNRKRLGAHRLAWKLFRSEIAPGLCVCHKCDVPACVNPDHLFLGTPADNAQDRREKGRSPRGEKHALAKLTAEQVSRIKAMLAEDRLYLTEIAQEFGVSQTTVRAIKAGRTWRHVETPAVTNTVTRDDESLS